MSIPRWATQALLFSQFHKPRCHFWPGPSFFVLEEDECFRETLGLDFLSPVAKALIRISFAPQADVSPVGGAHGLGLRQILRIGYAHCRLVRTEAVVQFA